jgi:hypothetical protein
LIWNGSQISEHANAQATKTYTSQATVKISEVLSLWLRKSEDCEVCTYLAKQS